MKATVAILFLAIGLSAQQGAQRIGGNVMAQSLVKKVQPTYPADMKADRQEATVVLQTTISPEGVPTSFSNQSPGVNQAFVEAAIAAVKEWRYRPVLLNGNPVEVLTTVTVNFTLAQ